MINRYVTIDGKELRLGYTTGSCAAAASKAAALMLLKGDIISNVDITTPKGINLCIEILEPFIGHNFVRCAVRKDSGDDPDATKDMLIYSTVSLTDVKGIAIDGGEGIGRVTKPGLDQKIGNAAINSVPRIMIATELVKVSETTGFKGGFSIVISAPEGIEIAKRTFNSRLGIIGGISILGTSGIVEPMSEKAIIDTIKAELNVARAIGKKSIIITPGNYGADFLCHQYNISSEEWVKCSNFLGETLDYATELGFTEILLVGHIGKLIKLAGGMFNTHSKYGDCRGEIASAHYLMQGGDRDKALKLLSCTTTEDMLELLEEDYAVNAVMNSILKKSEININYRLHGKVKVGVVLFSHRKGLLAKSATADEFMRSIKGE